MRKNLIQFGSVATAAGLLAFLAACADTKIPDFSGKGGGPKTGDLIGTGKGLVEVAKDLNKDMTYAEERDIGQSVALQVYASDGIGAPIRNTEVMKFVNLLGNGVGRHGDRPNMPYHVAVLDMDEVNAFCAPGGYIFLTKGLVLACDTEAELAFVIGHEVGHLVKKHALEQIKAGKALEGVAKIGQSMTPSQFKGFDEYVKKMAVELATKAFSKELEYEADALGLLYAYKTGYDPRAAVDFFKKLEAKGKKEGGLGKAYATHPTPESRIAAAEKIVKGWDLEGTVKNPARFAQIKTLLSAPSEKWPAVAAN